MGVSVEDTPLTAEAMLACRKLANVEQMYGYMVEHARGLERELAAANRSCDACLEEIDRLRAERNARATPSATPILDGRIASSNPSDHRDAMRDHDKPSRLKATEEMLRAVNNAHRALPASEWIDDTKHLQCTLDALAPFLPSATRVLQEALQELIDAPIRPGRSHVYAQGVYDARFGGDRNYTGHRDREEYLQGTRDGAVREALIRLKDRGVLPEYVHGGPRG